MNRKLVAEQIETACRDLLRQHRRVTVRSVMAELQRRYGAAGRTERIGKVLRHLQAMPVEHSLDESSADIKVLLERIEAAEARATRSEEIERQHQDYWARRYAEKAEELERKYAAALQARPAITADQYLRLKQRVAELERRLSEYEPLEP